MVDSVLEKLGVFYRWTPLRDDERQRYENMGCSITTKKHMLCHCTCTEETSVYEIRIN